MQIITFSRGAADKGMRLPHPVLTDKRLIEDLILFLQAFIVRGMVVWGDPISCGGHFGVVAASLP